ncbi:MAG TPA: alpha/beta fold hydrolase [Jiangellaceae bacterium]
MPGFVRTLMIVVSIVAVLVGLLWVFQRRLIYFPDTASVPPAGTVLPDARDVTLRTSDGLELGAWHVPAGGGGRDVTVLIANGNGGNRASRAPLAAELVAAGFDVLLFDYRGYGGNPGSPSSDGLVRDAHAALTYLVDDAEVPPDRIIYFGESLGAGVVTALAHTDPPAGLLLRSPFESLAAVGQHHYPFVPVGLLLRDEYPVASLVAGIDVPTTVVYGSEDTIIPPGQSRAVAHAAAGDVGVVEVDGAGHNDEVMFTGAELIGAVEALADRSVGPTAP